MTSPIFETPPKTADGCADAVSIVTDIAAVPAEAWDACAVPDHATANPFVSHAFLKALEDSRSVGSASGWRPSHLVLNDAAGSVTAVATAYVKHHSQGEYVFDHAWAEAYAQAGGRYYPKLQIAVPFTPVPGPRFMARPGADAARGRLTLATAAIELCERLGLSSAHATFLDSAAQAELAPLGYLARTGQQFHWIDGGYATFDDFLATFASRKRKAVKKERAEALRSGVEIAWINGKDITEAHWDAFYAFYADTGNRKWGRPYLNRAFFSLLGQSMADRCLLVMAKRDARYIAGALNLIGGDCLYGRYWGAIEHHPCLHFEVCYYQAIDYAIARGLKRVEAGAQGEHKLARGYLPVETYSAHWIADEGLRRAVERYLVRERMAVSEANAELSELSPYRRQYD
ncbi:MAG: GNAT family N-acetyltransferase [Hyphomicrobium sp.]